MGWKTPPAAPKVTVGNVDYFTLTQQQTKVNIRQNATIEQLTIARPVAPQPLSRRTPTAASRLRRLLQRPTLIQHPPTNQPPAARKGPMITVKLHPVAPLGLWAYDTPSLQGGPDEQPA